MEAQGLSAGQSVIFRSWTPPKTSGQIGVELIHLVMSQGDRGHGEGNTRIF